MPYKVSEIILFLLFHYSPGRRLKNRESSCRNDLQKAHFRFSQTCLQNSRDIPLALETSYRERYSRNLTLSRLNEAIILPLAPDKGDSLHYDPNMAASTCMDNDLKLLQRIRKMSLEHPADSNQTP